MRNNCFIPSKLRSKVNAWLSRNLIANKASIVLSRLGSVIKHFWKCPLLQGKSKKDQLTPVLPENALSSNIQISSLDSMKWWHKYQIRFQGLPRRYSLFACFFATLFTIVFLPVYAQTSPLFTDINTNLAVFTTTTGTYSGIYNSEVAWGDYDNDGKLDILLAGSTNVGPPITSASPIARVYRNTGNGFVDINAGLLGLNGASVAWGDYNNDGLLDIALAGYTSTFYTPSITKIYRNNGNNTFTDINAGLKGVAFGSLAWGDYDNDGKQDLLVTGDGVVPADEFVSKLYHNNGNGTFTEINAGLTPVLASSAAWGDYDNDGKLDILLAGFTKNSPGSNYAYFPIAKVYHNNGNGTFNDINAGLIGVGASSAVWGDYNNDGKLDILLTGNTDSTDDPKVSNGKPITKVYRNTGTGFVDSNAGLPGVRFSSAAWGDYNNDGMLDILLTGRDSSGNRMAKMYRNTGNGFSDSGAILPGVQYSSVAWGDYNNDGKLDILLTGDVGTGASGLMAKVFKNNFNPAGTVDWLTYGYDVQRTSYNPTETKLGVNNVSQLHKLWEFDLGGATNSQPVYARNVMYTVNGTPTNIVYTGSENGYFYALNADSGKKIWSRYLGAIQTGKDTSKLCLDMPKGIEGVTTTAHIDRATNRVYVAGGDDKVYALNLSNGNIVQGWPVKIADPSQLHVYGAINVYNGKLYAVVASHCDFTPYHGKAVEIDIATAKVTNNFYPTNDPVMSSSRDGGGIWGIGGAAIDPSNGDVYVAVGNAIGNPETYGYADRVVRLDSNLNVKSSHLPSVLPKDGDLDFGATPLLFKASSCPKSLLVAENKSGYLFLYDRNNINSGPLQSVQMAQSSSEGQFIGIPAFSPVNNMVYVSNPSSNGNYRQGMVALRLIGNCTLQLAWQQPAGNLKPAAFSPPTVANGVVYNANGLGSQVFAFDANTGYKLWTSSQLPGAVFATPTVVNGQLYIGSWDGKLRAFGI